MQVSRRSAFAVAGLVSVGVTLSACGLGGSGGTTASEAASAGPVEGEVTGTIEFATLQLQPTFTEYIEGVIADFEEQYPGTEVEWVDVPFEGAQEKFVADAAAGTLPDVVNLNPNFAQPLEAEGAFVNLDEAAPDVEELYVPGAWDAFQVPGQEGHFGFPWYLTSEVTMYNQALLEEAGLDPESPPATFDELYSDARTLAQAGAGDFYGIHPALENRVATDLAKLGVPLLDEEQTEWTFDTPEAVAYVEELKALYEEGVMPPDSITETHAQEIEAYQAEQIALFPSGPNFLTIVRENAPDVAEQTAVAPQITGERGVANMAVMGLLVPTTSENQATAIEFAKFMTNAENQLEFSKIVTILPSVTEALEDPYFTDTSDGTVESLARSISAEQIQSAENLVPVQFDDRVKNALVGRIQLAMQGEISAEQALDEAVAEANQITFGS
jgi:multiple sugar transport system substrate-binding protein